MATQTAPALTDQQKLDLIQAAQVRMQKKLGIDPSKSLAENVDHMRAHPDAEIRRRYGYLGTAPSTIDPVTRQRGLGEQADLVNFTMRDFGAEAGKVDAYSRPKFIEDKFQRVQVLEDWIGPLKPGQAWRQDINRESGKRVAEMEAAQRQRNAELDRRADEMLAGLGKTPATDASPKAQTFLSRDAFLALPSLDRQIEEVTKLESRASEMSANLAIRRNSEVGQNLLVASTVPTTAAHFATLSQDGKSAQAYQHYAAVQRALEAGQKVIDGQSPQAQSPQAKPQGKDVSDPAAKETKSAENNPAKTDAKAQTAGRGAAQGPRTSEERTEPLNRLQDRVATAMADGSDNGWTAEQKKAAQSFVQTDLSILKNGSREERQALTAQAREMRELLKNDQLGPEENFAPRVVDRQMVEGPARADGAAGPERTPTENRPNHEQRLERLETLQARVREIQSRGLSDKWTFEQQTMAQNFAIRDLRRDLQGGQQDAIQAEIQALTPLVRSVNPQIGLGTKGPQSSVNPRADFGTAAFASSWNDKTRFPEAEPPQRSGFHIEFKRVSPPSPWQAGFNDQTYVPELQTAAYDVRIENAPFGNRRPSTPSAPPPYPETLDQGRSLPEPTYREPPRPPEPMGQYDRRMSSGITWSGGPLVPQFSLYAAQTQQNPSVNLPDRNMLLVRDPLRDPSEEGGSPATRKPTVYQLG